MTPADREARRDGDRPAESTWHARCVVCGSANPTGFRLAFAAGANGVVECSLYCEPELEGYSNQLHGGVIAMLLDGAMTNCLHANGREGVTAALAIRYLHPVRTGRMVTVRAWIEQTHRRLCRVAGELVQDDRVAASASARFIERRG
jgi:uncharacterized protein (TIGR00369 family)